MVITQYNVSLIRLKPKYLEELRQWRNSDKIRLAMEYREHISHEMQVEWFQKVDDVNSYAYFIIRVDENNIGLANGKYLPPNDSEGGMFIWNAEYTNTHIPVIVSIILSDWNFYFLQNTFSSCKMIKSNEHVIAYNMNFGFKLRDGQENLENQYYTVTRGDYEKNAQSIRKMLKNLYPKMDDTILIQLEEEDSKNGVADFISRYYREYLAADTPVKFNLKQ